MPGVEVRASWVMIFSFRQRSWRVVHDLFTNELGLAPPLGNSMARFGNQGATRRCLPAAKDRKQPQVQVAEIAAIADRTAKS